MLIRSDARHIPLADESVHCVVTSPPYWGLRSYEGNPGMIGLEPTFGEHLENLVEVFREVRRVLRKDAVLFLNYGDAYAGSGKGPPGSSIQNTASCIGGNALIPAGFKPKDLMMMPARVAMALQADGWWLRSEIIWHKPNPMPESVTDRPTSSHEKVFLLTKSARYFYDAEAVRVPAKYPEGPNSPESIKSPYGQGFTRRAKVRGHEREHEGFMDKWDGMTKTEQQSSGANLRNVWKIATQGVKESHFATFPEKLVRPCILAGTSDMGCCAECGAPWVRVVEVSGRRGSSYHPHDKDAEQGQSKSQPSPEITRNTTGWSPTCDHDSDPIPCTVLDPFAGSGTVVRVAEIFGLRGIGCDLDYQDIAKKRTANVQRMLL